MLGNNKDTTSVVLLLCFMDICHNQMQVAEAHCRRRDLIQLLINESVVVETSQVSRVSLLPIHLGKKFKMLILVDHQFPYSAADAPRQSFPTPQVPHGQSRENFQVGGRQRGWSNSSRNERGKPFGRNTFSNHNGVSNNRRYPLMTPRCSPPRNTHVQEPVYMFNRESSPGDARPPPLNSAPRVVSEPMPNVPFYAGNRIVNNRGQTRSLSAREVNLHGLQRVGLASPANPQRNGPGPSSTQGLLELPSLPATLQTPSNDARVMGPLPRLIEGQGHIHEAKTIFYLNDFEKDVECSRTVHISGINLDMLLNHEIKNMMNECGIVESIHYLPTHTTHRAFVA